MSNFKRYLEEMRKQHGFFAAWPVTEPINVGDYGTLSNNYFTKQGNIKDLGIAFDTQPQSVGRQAAIEHASKGVEEGKLEATIQNHQTIPGELGLKITFKSEYSVYFKATKPTYFFLKNLHQLGSLITQAFQNGSWDQDFVIVTSVVHPDSTTIIIASADDASFELSGKVSCHDDLFLADAQTNITTKNSKHIGDNILAHKNLSPLFQLSRLKPTSMLDFILSRPQRMERIFHVTTDTDETTSNTSVSWNNVPMNVIKKILEHRQLPFEDAFELREINHNT